MALEGDAYYFYDERRYHHGPSTVFLECQRPGEWGRTASSLSIPGEEKHKALYSRNAPTASYQLPSHYDREPVGHPAPILRAGALRHGERYRLIHGEHTAEAISPIPGHYIHRAPEPGSAYTSRERRSLYFPQSDHASGSHAAPHGRPIGTLKGTSHPLTTHPEVAAAHGGRPLHLIETNKFHSTEDCGIKVYCPSAMTTAVSSAGGRTLLGPEKHVTSSAYSQRAIEAHHGGRRALRPTASQSLSVYGSQNSYEYDRRSPRPSSWSSRSASNTISAAAGASIAALPDHYDVVLKSKGDLPPWKNGESYKEALELRQWEALQRYQAARRLPTKRQTLSRGGKQKSSRRMERSARNANASAHQHEVSSSEKPAVALSSSTGVPRGGLAENDESLVMMKSHSREAEAQLAKLRSSPYLLQHPYHTRDGRHLQPGMWVVDFVFLKRASNSSSGVQESAAQSGEKYADTCPLSDILRGVEAGGATSKQSFRHPNAYIEPLPADYMPKKGEELVRRGGELGEQRLAASHAKALHRHYQWLGEGTHQQSTSHLENARYQLLAATIHPYTRIHRAQEESCAGSGAYDRRNGRGNSLEERLGTELGRPRAIHTLPSPRSSKKRKRHELISEAETASKEEFELRRALEEAAETEVAQVKVYEGLSSANRVVGSNKGHWERPERDSVSVSDEQRGTRRTPSSIPRVASHGKKEELGIVTARDWSDSEDQKLVQLAVLHYSSSASLSPTAASPREPGAMMSSREVDWKGVSSYLPGREPTDCRRRWRALQVEQTVETATKAAVGDVPSEMFDVAESSAVDCLRKWLWTPADDQRLKELVSRHQAYPEEDGKKKGGIDWLQVAAGFDSHKTGLSCKSRWEKICQAGKNDEDNSHSNSMCSSMGKEGPRKRPRRNAAVIADILRVDLDIT